MANKNIGILSLMAQADNKSVIQAVNSMDKTFQSEVNGKFNAIGDEIGKQAEDALKILNRTTLKDVKVTQPVSDFFLNILRSTSADDALNFIRKLNDAGFDNGLNCAAAERCKSLSGNHNAFN